MRHAIRALAVSLVFFASTLIGQGAPDQHPSGSNRNGNQLPSRSSGVVFNWELLRFQEGGEIDPDTEFPPFPMEPLTSSEDIERGDLLRYLGGLPTDPVFQESFARLFYAPAEWVEPKLREHLSEDTDGRIACLLRLREERAALKPLTSQVRHEAVYTVGSRVLDPKAPGGNYCSPNYSRPIPARLLKEVSSQPAEYPLMLLREEDFTCFQGRYQGMSLWIINPTRQVLAFQASDSRLTIAGVAIFQGNCKPLDFTEPSNCGNSRHRVFLEPGSCWRVAVPAYSGDQEAEVFYTVGWGTVFTRTNRVRAHLPKALLTAPEPTPPPGTLRTRM